MSWRQFSALGPLALDPRAFGAMFPATVLTENTVVDGAVVVTISGPLAARAGGFFDSYESILCRVDAALAAKPHTVVLAIDSPGGDGQGAFECARALRERCAASGAKLLAYVDGHACSAGYALACAAEKIGITSSGVVGSIGVYETLRDQTAADQAMGITYRVVSSGARKTDRNAHVPISDAAVAAAQTAVDHLAALFFAHVEAMRPSLSAEQARALDGGIAIGADAVAKHLADVEVASLSQLLGAVPSVAAQATKVKNMDEIRKSLQAVIDDANATAEDKEKAKAALAALDAAAPGAKAENPEDKPEDGTTAATALAEVHKLRAELAQRNEETERSRLLASRPDFTPEHVATLRTAPMALVREQVEKLPRVAFQPAAAAGVLPTTGEGQGAPAERVSPEVAARLDTRMGITRPEFGVRNVGREQHFGAPVPKKA